MKKKWGVLVLGLVMCVGSQQSTIAKSLKSEDIIKDKIEVADISSDFNQNNKIFMSFAQGLLEDKKNQEKIAAIDFHKVINTIETNSQQINYNLLNTEKLLTKNDFLSEKNKGIDKSDKIKKIIKMQKLASFISEEYNVPLVESEQIVYTTFIESHKKNLEPLLVLSIISVESTFKKNSKSYAGAVGLTQVMSNIHRKRIAQKKVDIWSVNGNIQIGTDILYDYVGLANGNVKKALQMYNGSSKDKKFTYSNKVMSKMNSFLVASK